jgi:cell division protein FtsZ
VIPAEELAPAELSEEARQQQEMLQLDPVAGRGRFAKTDPTIVDGEDLDVPTFLRKKR